jgi:steroid 5-alpha reductase family enzyme
MGDWLRMQIASIPALTPWLVLVALIVSSVGFKRLVYFVSIGYAFSMVGMVVVSALAMRTYLTWLTGLQLALLMVWGLRLGIFLMRRETNAAYRQRLATSGADDEEKGWLQKLPIWIGVSVLYVAMFSPALFALAGSDAPPATWGPWVQASGLALMAGGLALEATADQQKSAAKAKAPGEFVQSGVYSWVRCPNYLGEITFWAGNFVMGIPSYTSLLRWVIALIGLACIVLIMMGSTKRLERSQGGRYGALPAYQQYVTTVPVLFPFVPVYSLQNVRVYLE